MSETASTIPTEGRWVPPKAWKPGQSGNPKGRPKGPVDIAALARQHGPRCIEVAVDLLNNSTDDRIRLAAAVALLERGFGKPVQPLSSDPDNPLTVRYVVRLPTAIDSEDEWFKRYAPTAIDVEVEPAKD